MYYIGNFYKDKNIWITGASSGIGQALAVQLSAFGTRLVLSGRNRDGLEAVKEHCASEVFILPFDVAEYTGLEPLATRAIGAFGHLDMLMNNAGQGCRSLVIETDIETDERIMKVNYLGNIGLAKAVLPHFIERGTGRYVVVSSLAGKFGTKSRSAYAASKHALHGFYESLRAETYDQGIRVTMACPGFVDTNLLERSWNGKGRVINGAERVSKRMTANDCAIQILRAAAMGKEEVIIGETFKERISVDVKRFFPGLFSSMMKKANVS